MVPTRYRPYRMVGPRKGRLRPPLPSEPRWFNPTLILQSRNRSPRKKRGADFGGKVWGSGLVRLLIARGAPRLQKKGGVGLGASLGAGLVKGCAGLGAFRPPAPASAVLSIGVRLDLDGSHRRGPRWGPLVLLVPL